MRTTMLGLLILAALSGCATTRPERKTEQPYFNQNGQSLTLNTFTLDQSEFPLLSGAAALSQPPDFALPDEAEVRELLFALFAEHGYPLSPDHPFHYGKIHVALDGYNRAACVGYLFVSVDDFEAPRIKPDRSPDVRSLFYTEASPVRISGPEMLLFEQLNQTEQIYIALINAHQFAWPVADGEAGRAAAMDKLRARVSLYLRWVDARMAKRRAPQDPAPDAEP
jgi:hypothetical protein